MSGAGDGGSGPSGEPGGQPSEEELRAAYEAELSRVTVTDMLAQVTVSLLNLAARRLGPARGAEPPGAGASGAHAAGGRDLEQVRDAIDAVKALLAILERRVPGELRPLRDALSQLQIAYAGEMRAEPPPSGEPAVAPASSPSAGDGGEDGSPVPGEQPKRERGPGPGPAESSGRLWVPGR